MKIPIIVNGQEDTPIIVSSGEYKGTQRLNIRQYWTPPGQEEPIPTKKGVSLPLEKIEEVMSALQLILDSMEE